MLVSEKIKIKISGHNIKHYEKLGYEIPRYVDYRDRCSVKRGTEIEVNIQDLMKKSPIKVLRKCDHCGKIDAIRWYAYRDYCHKCASKLFPKETYTIEDVRKIFKENNCELLSTEYIRNDLSLEYICSCGIKSIIHFANFLMGQRCKQCGIIKSAKSRTRLDLTDEDRHRRILGYNHFIDTVRKRDNYKCQICEHQGKRWDGSLHVHHIESFLKNKELRLDINNGITLCKKCHRKFHNKYGIKNNNEKQFNEFLLIEKGV